MLFYNEGFRHVAEAATGNFDIEPKVYANASMNSLIARLWTYVNTLDKKS